MNCPFCHHLLYSRQRKTCEFCDAELPPECILNEEDFADLRAAQEDMQKLRAIEKEEQERRHRAFDEPVHPITYFLFP